MQSRSQRKSEKVEAAGGDVFTQLARFDLESDVLELVEQLRLNEMDLPIVRERRPLLGEIAMLNEAAGMRVALDAVVGDEPDARSHGFAESVRIIATHRNDPATVAAIAWRLGAGRLVRVLAQIHHVQIAAAGSIFARCAARAFEQSIQFA